MCTTKPVDNCEEDWHSCLWSLYLYGRVGKSCSHIGALLYWIEYAVWKRDGESCTSKVNKWIEPLTTKKVPCLPLDAIDFTSSEKWMKLYEHGKSTTYHKGCYYCYYHCCHCYYYCCYQYIPLLIPLPLLLL